MLKKNYNLVGLVQWWFTKRNKYIPKMSYD
jgi:hypothetical protein